MAVTEGCKKGHGPASARRDSAGKFYCLACNAERQRAYRKRRPPRSRLVTSTCVVCGATFEARSHWHKRTCSEKCQRQHANNLRSQRVQARRLPVAPLIQYALDHDIDFRPEGLDGTVGFFQADEYAVKLLGTHPALIYGEQWWQAAAA